MSLFSLGSWIAEERKRARKEFQESGLGITSVGGLLQPEHAYYKGRLATLRRLSARLRQGK